MQAAFWRINMPAGHGLSPPKSSNMPRCSGFRMLSRLPLSWLPYRGCCRTTLPRQPSKTRSRAGVLGNFTNDFLAFLKTIAGTPGEPPVIP